MPIRSFITVIALFICNSLFAQVSPADSIPSAKTPYVPELRSFNQTAYISIPGPSCFAGINYDIRFNGTNKGLGTRIGIGIAPDYAETRYDRKTKVTTKFSRPIMATIPFGLNYVMGAKNIL